MTSADQPVPGRAAGPAGARPEGHSENPVAARDIAAIELQLGRTPRGVRGVAHRCPCGLPDVVRTAPRLEDGTPFPTLYYLTCPRAASAIGRMENSGRMREMQDRLATDPGLAEAYTRAHESYIEERAEQARLDGVEPLPEGMQSTGGMPARVKCLHALVGHELAAPGTNPFGAEALEELPQWWDRGPCVCVDEDAREGSEGNGS
ncbi:DUF501 domain-containing protein [Nocardiopsis tropica]|jgi:hypothetical protein|uniref:DUF501 domain-containing protein n=1 Tax=Nocardiopsis tropica TaxID=109330 RepID=A0ABU7KXX3_9ACTN|nr:DUF501 domain-containing protein [Nocardiopsis umidischolae]MEE2053834.1 DUF501 domain-containing protein [Nocardiopsis umidischolae]